MKDKNLITVVDNTIKDFEYKMNIICEQEKELDTPNIISIIGGRGFGKTHTLNKIIVNDTNK